MALGPKELGLSNDERRLASVLEGKVDEHLKEFFLAGKPISVIFNDIQVSSMSKRVVHAVACRFRKVEGWEKVEYNEISMTFTPDPKLT